MFDSARDKYGAISKLQSSQLANACHGQTSEWPVAAKAFALNLRSPALANGYMLRWQLTPPRMACATVPFAILELK